MNRANIAFLSSLTCFAVAADDLSFPTTPPTAPNDAAKTFHVLDGFEMQLIAAEPLVTDPVALTYDEDGRAYVCEMNDYPYTDKEKHKHAQENPTDQPIGKVRLLTDTDGDGVFDKASVFADGLSWPTGAACWKGGVFVCATPDIWYLKDTNGDGVADVRQKVFTGFKKLNVQAVMNNPIWGLDHRIYVAGGSNGGEIQRVPGSESVMPMSKDFKPLSIKRNDFSFDPSTGDVRLESGGARFGNTFDDWGNRFLCNIRNPCQHVVLPYRYLARNPYLVVPSALNDCAEAGDQLPVYRTSPPEPWREFRAKRWVQEGSTLPKSELVGAGVVTSSSGITVYRGDAYPKEYRDFAFVADVAGNLFYRMKLVPDGVTFKAVQVDGNKNFCTSDDLWFRPVNFVNAPDGCLHVCDMYREVIEHPWSIPDDIHSSLDLLRGRDRGRIWRLAPKSGPLSPLSGNQTPPESAQRTERTTFEVRPTPKLSAASTAELVALLDHPNAWHRETAQRLLFERQDRVAEQPLLLMAKQGKTAEGRIGALWGLDGVGFSNLQPPKKVMIKGIDGVPDQMLQVKEIGVSGADRFVVGAMQDTSFQVRRQAAVIAGVRVWKLEGSKEITGVARALAVDPDQRVRFQAIIDGGRLGGFWGFLGPASEGQKERLARDVTDPWVRIALLSRPIEEIPVLASDLFKSRAEGIDVLLEELCEIIGREKRDPTVRFAINQLAAATVQANAAHGLQGLIRGLATHGVSLGEMIDSQATKAWLKAQIAEQAKNVFDHAADLQTRLQGLRFLASDVFSEAQAGIVRLLVPSEPQELQLAALEALGSYREPAVADILIESWPKLTPTLRDKAITLMLSRLDRIAKLLDAIEAKRITPAQLSVAAKATLGRQKDAGLAERIAKLIGDGASANRREVIERYEAALFGSNADTPVRAGVVNADRSVRITTDAARGAKVYETACMVCHRHVDRGNDVGPNLGTIKAWTAEQILTNVLDPNREVSPNFALYIVETNDGRTLSGLIASETAGNLTLKRADGGTDTVLRSEIKSLTSPGISLMPEGLEAAITPQQMGDLIAFLKQ